MPSDKTNSISCSNLSTQTKNKLHISKKNKNSCSKSCSKSCSESCSDSELYSKTKNKLDASKNNKEQNKKENTKNNDQNLYPIEKYLQEKKYEELNKNIYKYNLTERDLALLIREKNDIINWTSIWKKFTFNNIDDLLSFCQKYKLYEDWNISIVNCIDLGDLGNKKDVLQYLYAMNIYKIKCSKSELLESKFYKFMTDNKIPITEKHIKYITNKYNKQFFQQYVTSLPNNTDEKKEGICVDGDGELLLKCKTTDDIDNFICEKKYNVNSDTIFMACRNNFDFKLIKHLLSFKIKYNENIINKIINCYKNNEEIVNLLVALSSQFCFTQKNYIAMVTSQYFTNIFSENIIKNLTIDKNFVEKFLESIIVYNTNSSILVPLLKNIETLSNNKESIDGILALYCGTIYILGGKGITRIKNLKINFNAKLSKECLKFCCKNLRNMKYDLMTIFKEDGVQPDADCMKNFIKITNHTKEGNYLLDLIN